MFAGGGPSSGYTLYIIYTSKNVGFYHIWQENRLVSVCCMVCFFDSGDFWLAEWGATHCRAGRDAFGVW